MNTLSINRVSVISGSAVKMFCCICKQLKEITLCESLNYSTPKQIQQMPSNDEHMALVWQVKNALFH